MSSPRNRSRLALPLLLSCALLSSCGGDDDDDDDASDRTPKSVTIEGKRASGRQATAKVAGIVDRPVSVSIRVSAGPKQRVAVTWGLSCPERDKDKDKGTGGTYATTPPNVRVLRLPKRDIAFCAVNAQVQLTRSGRARVTIIGSEG